MLKANVVYSYDPLKKILIEVWHNPEIDSVNLPIKNSTTIIRVRHELKLMSSNATYHHSKVLHLRHPNSRQKRVWTILKGENIYFLLKQFSEVLNSYCSPVEIPIEIKFKNELEYIVL